MEKQKHVCVCEDCKAEIPFFWFYKEHKLCPGCLVKHIDEGMLKND